MDNLEIEGEQKSIVIKESYHEKKPENAHSRVVVNKNSKLPRLPTNKYKQ